MGSVRDKAREVLKVIPPLGEEIKSTVGGKTKASNGGVTPATNPLFKQVTNIEHSQLQTSWDALDKAGDTGSPGLTSCNGFVGYYGALTTGYGDDKNSLGVFDLPDRLKRKGLAAAWIESGPDVRPQYGDICLWAKTHICVSLEFEGDTWHHADGGQGGRKTGYDIVKRRKDSWNHKLLRGWLDVEVFAGLYAAKSAGPIPDWLPTWWLVTWRGVRYYYRFGKDNTVIWSRHSPLAAGQGPIGDGEPGRYIVTDMGRKVIIHWPGETTETFSYVPSSSPYEETMTGSWNGREPMSAVTCF